VFAGKKSAQIREILISESAWEEMTYLFAPSLTLLSTLKGKVSDLTQKWEGNIGAEAPDYHLLMNQLEAVEKQIFSRIGAWKKSSLL